MSVKPLLPVVNLTGGGGMYVEPFRSASREAYVLKLVAARLGDALDGGIVIRHHEETRFFSVESLH